MRLGDLDALYDKVSGHVTSVSVCMTVAEAKGQTEFKNRCLDDIANAPTIDAIPVEYLMKYAQLPTEFAIAAWRKQDKDAQEKQIKRLDKPMSLDDALNLVNEVFPLGQNEQEAR